MSSLRTLPAWKKLCFWGAALTLITGCLNLTWNTNLLGSGQMCHGLLPGALTEDAFNHPGRLHDSPLGSPPRGNDTKFLCQVKLTSKLMPGSDTRYLQVGGSPESPDFQFTSGAWPFPAKMSFFSTGATGAVSDESGWVLLPGSCQPKESSDAKNHHVYVVEGSTTGGKMKRLGLARLLVEAANRVARQAGCATETLGAPAQLQTPATTTDTDFFNACGIRGFAINHFSTLTPGNIQERAQKMPSPIWACDLLLSQDRSPYASFAVVRDQHLVSEISKSLDRTQRPVPNGWHARGFTGSGGLVASCGGKDTYFAVRIGPGYHATANESDDSGDSMSLLQSFVSAVGKKMGCAGIAP